MSFIWARSAGTPVRTAYFAIGNIVLGMGWTTACAIEATSGGAGNGQAGASGRAGASSGGKGGRGGSGAGGAGEGGEGGHVGEAGATGTDGGESGTSGSSATGGGGGQLGVAGTGAGLGGTQGGTSGQSGASAGVAGGGGTTIQCTDSCTAECPCDVGEGPCTLDTECADSLTCGTGAGSKYGLAGNVCVPAHCNNDQIDGGETTRDCGGECGCPVLELLSAQASCALDASYDGGVVVGTEGDQAMRWIGPTMADPSGGLPDSSGTTVAHAVDGSGGLVVGEQAADTLNPVATTWSAPSFDPEILPPPNGAVLGVSADGAVLVGWVKGSGSTRRAVAGDSTSPFPFPIDSAGYSSQANGVSADGAVIVGARAASSADPELRPVRWLGDPLAMSPLGTLSAGTGFGEATAANSSGTVIVGFIGGPSGTEAFRWTQGTLAGLGDLSGGLFNSTALDVSADGERIVGVGEVSGSFPTERAFLYDPIYGLRSVVDAMIERGLEALPSGWVITRANAISGDGRVIVGCLQTPEFSEQAYRLTLEP